MTLWNELPFCADDNKNDADEDGKDAEKDGVTPPKLILSPKVRAKLRIRSYEIGEPLAAGNFGAVYRGTMGTNSACAVKVIVPKKSEIMFLATEMYALMHIKHKHVTQVYDLFITNKSQLIIFMELAPGGDLDGYIWHENTEPLSECEVRHFYRQFGDAFRFMHYQGIAHQDIKPANILLDKSKKVCKVSDFGLALIGFDAQSGRPDLAKNYRGSTYYVAPEVGACYLYGYQYCPFKADVWSVGVMLYEMLNRSRPFECVSRVDPVTKQRVVDYEAMLISQVNLNYTINRENLSWAARDAIRTHLEPKPNIRPNFAQILYYDPWLKIQGRI